MFGKKAFAIIDAGWNKDQHECEITFEDDNGIRYHTIAMGVSNQEIRRAVFDAVKDAWITAEFQLGNDKPARDKARAAIAKAKSND